MQMFFIFFPKFCVGHLISVLHFAESGEKIKFSEGGL